MRRYILGRLLALVFVAFGVSVLVFILLRAVPGDAAVMILGEEGGSQEQLAILRRQLGLDRPLTVQFIDWLGHLARGDLGQSFHARRSVSELVREALPVTLWLTFGSLVISVALGIPLGVISAIRRDTFADVLLRVVSMVGLSMPHFWFAIVFILIFSVYIPLLPSADFVSPTQPLQSLRHLALPAFSLGLSSAAVIMRMTRSAMLEVLGQDYIRTARSKGLNERSVIYGHALRNAFLNVLTIIGFQLGHLLSGSIVIETIFRWPGMGMLVYRAIGTRDYPVAQGVVLYTAFLYSLVTLSVDILYTYVDPRIRYD
jgi:peptide/nickel transport system permease protein